MGDEKEFEIIFNNLLSNAIKYNIDNGEIHFIIESRKEQLTISMKDTGIGMSEEETAKVFRDFIRIKNVKTQNISGTGLGLSIVKKIVSLYGGQINLKSIVDKGTEFVIVLPLHIA
ncbi:MAG: ATP-binding protein [Chloroflexia bacterium]|nr:ATP-binding protein [Chloroflexia bacterium]